MGSKTIHVIVPIYNTEAQLEKCVDSITSQTYRDLDIILVDDGSPDGSPQLCEKLAGEDTRIRVIHKENGGLSSARNAGMELVTDGYVTFVDSDDYIEPDMCEFLMDLAEKTGAQIAQCGLYRNGSESYYQNSDQTVLNLEEAIVEFEKTDGIYFSGAVCKLYSYPVIADVRFEVCGYEDQRYNMQLLFHCDKDTVIAVCNVPKYHYVTQPGSLTKSGLKAYWFDLLITGERTYRVAREKYPHNRRVLKSVDARYCHSATDLCIEIAREKRFTERFAQVRKQAMQFKWQVLLDPGFPMEKWYKKQFLVLWFAPALFKWIHGR